MRHRAVKKLAVVAALSATMNGSILRAAEAAPAALLGQPATNATAFTYAIDFDLSYRDLLGPNKNAGTTNTPAAPESNAGAATTNGAAISRETPRALGLSKLRAAIEWRHQNTSTLNIVLRPDAANRFLRSGDAANSGAEDVTATAPIPREDDARAGSTYLPSPTIRLLDAYQITLFPESSFAASIGVFEELSPARSSFPDILDFGLRAQMPAKFGALRLRWQGQRVAPDRPAPSDMGRFMIDSYAIQGDGDRAEAQGGKRHSFDTAPVAADPYYGGAVYLGYFPLAGLELGLLAGMQDASDDTSGATKSATFGEFLAVEKIKTERFPTKITVDLRRGGERFRGASPLPSQRVQQSVSLSSATEVAANVWYLFGTHFGTSDRMFEGGGAGELDRFRGWQIETGVLGTVGRDVAIEFLICQENRTETAPGASAKGGFSDADGDRKSLRRMGLTVSYDLDDRN